MPRRSKAKNHDRTVTVADELPSVASGNARIRQPGSPEPYETRYEHEYRARYFQAPSCSQPADVPVKCPVFSSKRMNAALPPPAGETGWTRIRQILNGRRLPMWLHDEVKFK